MNIYLRVNVYVSKLVSYITYDASCISYESCAYITTITESLNVELTTIILPSHFIDVIGI